MSTVEDVLRDTYAAGIQIEADPPDLIVTPADRLTPQLEDRLRCYKADIVRRLQLEGSMRRLQATSVSIAVWEDGSIRVVVTDSETAQAIDGGATVYSPPDMYYYVQLDPRERRMLQLQASV